MTYPFLWSMAVTVAMAIGRPCPLLPSSAPLYDFCLDLGGVVCVLYSLFAVALERGNDR